MKIDKDKEIIFVNVGTKDQRKVHYHKDVVKHPANIES